MTTLERDVCIHGRLECVATDLCVEINTGICQKPYIGKPPHCGNATCKLRHEYAEGGVVRGMGPNTPTVTNERGGSQSALPYRFDLIDARAMFAMAEVLHTGAEKYGEGNWKDISVEDHLNHMIAHAYAYLAGDRSDDHLSHALCRATFALGVELGDE